jgi:hypothetical protein
MLCRWSLSPMKLVGLNTLMRVLTVLKTRLSCFAASNGPCRGVPYHAVHLEYLPIINLGRNVPSRRPPVLLLLVSIAMKEARIYLD